MGDAAFLTDGPGKPANLPFLAAIRFFEPNQISDAGEVKPGNWFEVGKMGAFN